MIETYFESIEKTILYFKRIIKSYSIEKKIYNQTQGFIRGDIFFIDDSQFCFVEVKDAEIKPKTKYRYQYMDKDNQLIFRYDNANHHREITTFPHHKHVEDGVLESPEPELVEVLMEIQQLVRQKAG
ncbi:MAG: hypothetical protein GTO45_41960 [Candidatus Aminicenantes bacterium]|nr:hypothetical protein [Candidatus Aminicenantes bacterium]NIM83423.1 hypothetical protein [Candidatus Aminicenantes bacterium]NIN24694.1 hypothetical protein [Candidatus Aminicenantes bacterium]NIN48455.1 hypothetical protein [Candidatus Aminicenantes bacterium]NIN91352.1 hypothetical protein [Candidatus Aminicenantes bacterium]